MKPDLYTIFFTCHRLKHFPIFLQDHDQTQSLCTCQGSNIQHNLFYGYKISKLFLTSTCKWKGIKQLKNPLEGFPSVLIIIYTFHIITLSI
jgi:hypothetical protein